MYVESARTRQGLLRKVVATKFVVGPCRLAGLLPSNFSFSMDSTAHWSYVHDIVGLPHSLQPDGNRELHGLLMAVHDVKGVGNVLVETDAQSEKLFVTVWYAQDPARPMPFGPVEAEIEHLLFLLAPAETN